MIEEFVKANAANNSGAMTELADESLRSVSGGGTASNGTEGYYSPPDDHVITIADQIFRAPEAILQPVIPENNFPSPEI